ncbi:MAG TPA: hypothetical protein VFR09_01325 [Alphaproteobacteria bacterium]|nr:hypothetical protein [Alphaproteobacteria bacterium]
MQIARILRHLFFALLLTIISLGPILIVMRIIDAVRQGEGFSIDCVLAAFGTVAMYLMAVPLMLFGGKGVSVQMHIGTGPALGVGALFAVYAGFLIWRD